MVEEKKLAQVAPRRDEYEGYRDAVVEERVEANADQNALIPCIAGRYDVLECMGQGSQGEVYRARRRTDGAEVAIKVMHIKSVKNWKMYELRGEGAFGDRYRGRGEVLRGDRRLR